jgi:hypothetical protein
METNKEEIIKKGIIVGVIVFVVTHAVVEAGLRIFLTMNTGIPRNAFQAVFFPSLSIVQFLCRPASHVFLFLGGYNTIMSSNSLFLIENRILILRAIDLLFWIGASILFMNWQQKRKSV